MKRGFFVFISLLLLLSIVCAHEVTNKCAQLDCLEGGDISFNVTMTENASSFIENSTLRIKYVVYSDIQIKSNSDIVASYDGIVNLTKSDPTGTITMGGITPTPDIDGTARLELCFNRTTGGEKYSLFTGTTGGISDTGARTRITFFFDWAHMEFESEIICQRFSVGNVLSLSLIECQSDEDCDSNKVCEGYVCVVLECDKCYHGEDHVCVKDECCTFHDCADDEICTNHGCTELSCANDEVARDHRCNRISCSFFEEPQKGKCVFNSLWIFVPAFVVIVAVVVMFFLVFPKNPISEKWYKR